MGQLEPGDREEMLLRGILNGDTETNIEPGSRKEMLLKAILENGGGGGGGGGGGLPDVTDADNGDFARVVNGAWGKDAGDDIARIDGYYESMGVGYADQLNSSQGVTNTAPYNFRTTGGSADVGGRKKEKIVGGTIGWNQQIENGDFASSAGWNANRCSLSVADNVATLTMADNVTASASLGRTGTTSLPAGHLYLCRATVRSGYTSGVCFRLGGTNSANIVLAANTRTTLERVIQKGTSNEGFLIYPNKGGDAEVGDIFTVEKVMVIDLTQMFGSRIAERIASLESNETGSGLEWIRSYGFITRDYYSFDPGSLLTVNTTASVSRGFNLLDDGTAKLVGGKQVQITGTYSSIAYTDINGQSETLTPDTDGKFTPAKNGVLTVTGSDSTTCVHLVWSGTRDGDYEEYREVRTEVAGKTATRKYGYVDMGTLTWSYEERPSAPNRFHAAVTGIKTPTTNDERATGIVTADYVASGVPIGSTDGDKLIARYTNGQVYILDSAYSTAADFKTAVTGKILVYELAAPVTETLGDSPYLQGTLKLDADNNLYYEGDTVDLGENLWCDDFGTEEFEDSRPVPMPVGHQTLYPANLRDKLQHLPGLASEDGWYVVQQSGTQMYLRSVREVIAPYVVGLEFDASEDRYVASCTNGEIAEAFIEGRRVFLEFEIPGYTGWQYMAEVCVGGANLDNERVTAFFAQMVDPFSGALVSLYSSPGTDDSDTWHMQTYPLTGA